MQQMFWDGLAVAISSHVCRKLFKSHLPGLILKNLPVNLYSTWKTIAFDLKLI